MRARAGPISGLVLLVNDGTASSAELIAGALQDHDRAVIVGLPTYGKGVLQTTYPLESDMAIKLTTARWFTPSGRSINRARTHSDSVLADARLFATMHGVRFRTDRGRPLPEGKGIQPDLMVRRDAYTSGERAFLDSLGSNYAAFRGALADCALAVKAQTGVTSEDFAVTPTMRERVRTELGGPRRSRGARPVRQRRRPTSTGSLAMRLPGRCSETRPRAGVGCWTIARCRRRSICSIAGSTEDELIRLAQATTN